MNTQPEALRLADMIERYNAGVLSQAIVEDYCKASAELRRLHAEVCRVTETLRQALDVNMNQERVDEMMKSALGWEWEDVK